MLKTRLRAPGVLPLLLEPVRLLDCSFIFESVAATKPLTPRHIPLVLVMTVLGQVPIVLYALSR